MVDIDSYELGFDKLTTVFDEIIIYIRQRFVGSTEFGEEIDDITLSLETEEDGYLILHCLAQRGEKSEVLFQKAIHIIANKYDMVNDLEIAQEFTKSLATHIQHHFKTKWGRDISQKDLLHNTFIVSAATHYGIPEWTKTLANMITQREIKYTYLFDTVITHTEHHKFITDVTEHELDTLIQEGYLDPASSRAKVWEIRDPEICRLVNILPRSNEQAEYWFWNVMLKKKYLSDFEKAKILHGDILKIMSYYSGVENKYIMYV